MPAAQLGGAVRAPSPLLVNPLEYPLTSPASCCLRTLATALRLWSVHSP